MVVLILVFIVCVILLEYYLRRFRIGPVKSSSMTPTFEVGDWIIVDTNVDTDKLKVDSIVTFNYYGDIFVKRIKGIDGDVVEINNESLLLNGVEQEEEFIQYPADYYYKSTQVPPGHFLMFGDNRKDSYDSHSWLDPFISEDQITGCVIHAFRYRWLRVLTLVYLDAKDRLRREKEEY